MRSYARNFGRNRAHQHRRRIDGLASRHVHAHGIDRRNHLAQCRRAILIHPGLRPLPLVKGLDPLRGKTQRIPFLLANMVIGLLDFFRSDFHLIRSERDFVELFGEAKNRFVTIPAPRPGGSF